MPTKLKFRRGTTTELQTMVGQVGEVFIDTDKNVPVVQDGITPGGHPLISEEYLLNNSLPPKQGVDKTYLAVENGEAVWKELTVLPIGSVVKFPSNISVSEKDFLKLDGSVKLVSEYPGLQEIFGNTLSFADTVAYGNTNLDYETGFFSSWDYTGTFKAHNGDADSEHMVYDGSHYVRILGQYANINNGSQFAVQKSSNGTVWTSTFVSPFSNQANRCRYVCTDGRGTIYLLADRTSDNNVILAKSVDHGQSWTEIPLKLTNNQTLEIVRPLTKIAYIKPRSSVQTNAIEWQPESVYELNDLVYYGDSIYQITSVADIPDPWANSGVLNTLADLNSVSGDPIDLMVGDETMDLMAKNLPLTSTIPPSHKSSSASNGDYTLTYYGVYDLGCLVLYANGNVYISYLNQGEKFKLVINSNSDYVGQNLIQTNNGLVSCHIYMNGDRVGGWIWEDKKTTPEEINPETGEPYGNYYLNYQEGYAQIDYPATLIGGETKYITAPPWYANEISFYKEPAMCYKADTNQIIVAYTTNSGSIKLHSINSVATEDSSFIPETVMDESVGEMRLNFKLIAELSTDRGLRKIHWSPIFGIMVFSGSLIYTLNVETSDWKVVSGIDYDSYMNYSSCINVEDGVLVACTDRILKITYGQKVQLPLLQDDFDLSFQSSYFVKI